MIGAKRTYTEYRAERGQVAWTEEKSLCKGSEAEKSTVFWKN